MRSPKELLFRLRQESANAFLLAFPPRLSLDVAGPLPMLAHRETVRARVSGEEVERLAGQIDSSSKIAWRRDPLSGVESPRNYFRSIRYLDASRSGDHKIIWDLNRHQHLVLLAQSFALTGNIARIRAIEAQIDHWLEDNPMHRGMNWTSALEVAFRALSWLWIIHLCGDSMDPAFRARMIRALYQHGVHLEYNLSVYFSPNTHLLGEAVALHALGALIPQFPRAARWREIGARITEEQMRFQVRDDGSHFEQSTYYHVYAVDLFLFHALLSRPGVDYLAKLQRMAEFLDAIHTTEGNMPFLGDDDGGRVFFPYGDRHQFGRATLATCAAMFGRWEWLRDPADLEIQAAWWLANLPPPKTIPAKNDSVYFPDAGLAVFRSAGVHAIFDAGPFGYGGAGHSHSDTLNLVIDGVLIDPGTYTYGSAWRDRFRGTAAHNTIRIDGLDQARPAGPFRWNQKPAVRLISWTENEAVAECSYAGFTHRRRVRFIQPDRFEITDDVTGPPGEHDIEQFWHPASLEIANAAVLTLPATPTLSVGHASHCHGEKHDSPVLTLRTRCTLPYRSVAHALLRAAPPLMETPAKIE